MTITDALLAFATVEADRDARDMMRLSLFDWAVCGLGGAGDPGFDAFRRSVLAQGGQAEASVLGGGRLPAPSAALLNGTLSHALDFDDTHFAHIGHPSVAVVPAALALSQRNGLSFDAMLDAALVGVEASIHVGLWLGRAHYQIGFHQTATAGAFGATLAAARLLDLTPLQMRHALGLCASLASGVKAQFGTAAKPLNAGLAARSGVEAALWAHTGMTAAADGLAGSLGFGDTHHAAGATDHLETLGQRPWRIMSISHKFHACCHGLHAMLEALGDADISPDDISRVTVKTHPRWMSVCNKPDPDTGLAAKFSYRHTAAMALSGCSTAHSQMFTDQVAIDPGLVALRQRVFVVEDAELTEMQARVRLERQSGHPIEVFHDLAAPLTPATRERKLRDKASGVLGTAPAEQLWSAVAQGDLAQFSAALERS
ncbi:MmgE/PrpD family protein [Roseobacter sp. YSTF-M11]|uniref:MmgE/PrpD family protein n=1 Tax=Roseobacter insulae TaxID=2859783 RepID=A0A9X1FW48_9RHOB|nr:MmgE/PrpD family protein [Roseobacter insulae]MBW4708816.1 MmgE/PrpD family protein [Roseobacter insulae]